jgi:hypothetical protein
VRTAGELSVAGADNGRDLRPRRPAGVSSIVGTLGLAGRCYGRLVDCFHSPAVDLDRLSRKWTQQAMGLFPVYRYAGRPVLLGDGIKIPKSGRKMPAVKLLYQESEGNTKHRYIVEHSVQVVSMLVAAGSFFAVPLAAVPDDQRLDRSLGRARAQQ